MALPLMSSMLVGLGATLTLDLWTLFLKFAFRIPSSNFCLVGRWILFMQEGIFSHANIGSAPKKSQECIVGWIAHYMIGITFATSFLVVAGIGWLQHPTLTAALAFGLVTVLVPFFIMQPLLGLGFASSKTRNPTQARLRSLTNHAVFGLGLYLFGVLAHWLL